jgi:enediyne biosynthesis protein E4
VTLIGPTSNRDGLGAVVKVTAGGLTQTKVFDGDSGYLSHSVYPLYFGLGASEKVDSIEVGWPSGKKQTVSSPIKINSTIEVKEQLP